MSINANPAITPTLPGARVLADALPGERGRDLLLVLAGAGLTTLGAQVAIHVPGSPVPITGQTLGVVLAGATLGARRGGLSQLVYLLLGLFLPVYANGQSGLAVVTGANGGYMFGFIIAGTLVGWAAEHHAERRLLIAPFTFALGQLAIFGIGVPWLKFVTGMSWTDAVHAGFLPFIVGGAVKAVAAATAMPTAWRIQRRLSRRG
ncbi:MAG: biotin transporter BioY [Solirubrobacteraceae bacterium]